ncbi:MAG: hypothetical protein HYW71_02600 [Candidatus Niyogibacteria bacterium]|nr:hypothetical protein [Candidatus Niyogibacteria bacterium]
MPNYRKNIILLLILFILLSLPAEIKAIGDDFFITFLPDNPTPNSPVTVKLKSYQFDVNRAAITWEVDGKVIAGGLSEKTIQLTSPDLGKTKKLIVYVTTADGIQASQTFILNGNDLDFLWEAMTSVPAGYKGKALPSAGSTVKVSAIPYLFKDNKKLSPESLVYEWSLDFNKKISASGAGKDSFTFSLDGNQDRTIVLKVSDRLETISFEKGFTISGDNTPPEILFYEEHPLEGPIYRRALLEEVSLRANDLALRAEPFYFSQENIANLSYEWKMNNKPLANEERPRVLNLLAPAQSAGKTAIEVTIKHPDKFLQFADAALDIIFGE